MDFEVRKLRIMEAQMKGIQDIEVFKYRFKCSDLYHNQLTNHQEWDLSSRSTSLEMQRLWIEHFESSLRIAEVFTYKIPLVEVKCALKINFLFLFET